jgi:hypothetical protein
MVKRVRLAAVASVVVLPAFLTLSACAHTHHHTVVHHHVVVHHVVRRHH